MDLRQNKLVLFKFETMSCDGENDQDTCQYKKQEWSLTHVLSRPSDSWDFNLRTGFTSFPPIILVANIIHRLNLFVLPFFVH